MLKWMVWFPLKLARWGLSIIGLAALVLTALLATPPPAGIDLGFAGGPRR